MTVKELKDKLVGVPGNTPIAVATGFGYANVFEGGVRLGKIDLDHAYNDEVMDEATRYTRDLTATYLIIE